MGSQQTKDGKDNEITFERVCEFYDYLRYGELPDTIRTPSPKTSNNKAMGIIYFLQEHMDLLPDSIEMCCSCKELYDSYESGYTDEKHGRLYCDGCSP